MARLGWEHQRPSRVTREFGLTAAVAAPIVVDSRGWGIISATSASGPLVRGIENRLRRFANLAGAAVSNAASREPLIALRARVLAGS